MDKKIWLNLVLSIIVALPVGYLVAMLLTPLLWRLEGILHIELAGHSGPSDWVIYVITFITALLLFLIFNKIIKKR